MFVNNRTPGFLIPKFTIHHPPITIPLNTNMSVGRLELPTNGLKGHCSTIELHAHNQVIIVARDGVSVNRFGQFTARSPCLPGRV